MAPQANFIDIHKSEVHQIMSRNKYLKNLSDQNILSRQEINYIAQESVKTGLWVGFGVGFGTATLIVLLLVRFVL